MTAVLVALCAVLGLLIGSFLNVVIWRVPRGDSVVRPPSACPGCGTPIRPRDNVPVLSWLLLKGRCRDCGEPISALYPAASAVALALIDLDVHRLPNSIVLPSYVVGAVLLGVPSLIEGDYGQLLRAAIGAAVLYAFYFALVLVYPSGMGFGDVKLAGVLGMYLAWLGWAELAVGAFLGFLLGGALGGLLLVTRKAGRKSKIPFGPFMLLGAFVGIFIGNPVADWYLGTMGL